MSKVDSNEGGAQAAKPKVQIKPLLRLLQFAQHRQVRLHSDENGLWLEDMGAGAARCRISAQALQQGLTDGLFKVGTNGSFYQLPQADAFRKRHSTGAPSADFARQHQELEQRVVRGDGKGSVLQRPVQRNRKSVPLAAFERLKAADGTAYFPPQLIQAGETLSRDFERAHLSPSITSRWEPRLGGSKGAAYNHTADLSDQAAHARQRFNRAVSAIGPELSGVVVDALCFEKGLELIERERQWPARSAKLMLRTGLEVLARHYQPAQKRQAPLRSWAVDGL